MRDPLTSTADPFIGYILPASRAARPVTRQEHNRFLTGLFNALLISGVIWACIAVLGLMMWGALSAADQHIAMTVKRDQEQLAPRAYRSVVVDLREASR